LLKSSDDIVFVLGSWRFVIGVVDGDGERRPITEAVPHRCSVLAEKSQV